MKISFENLHRSTQHLSFTFLANDYRFETAYWYEGVDFYALEKLYGIAFMENVYFHIMAFEFNKLLSLAPTEIDFGPYKNLVTPAFHQLWVTIAHKYKSAIAYPPALQDKLLEEMEQGNQMARDYFNEHLLI